MNRIFTTSILYLIIAIFISIVVIPLLYLTTISLSSNTELNDFPKGFLPDFKEGMEVEWNDEESQYDIYRYSSEDNRQNLYSGTDFDDISRYLERYMNIEVEPETLEEDFEPVKNTDDTLEITYNKSLFANYIKFFDVFGGAGEALVNSIKAVVYTILLSLSIGGMVGYALARTDIKGKEPISFAALIVRMFPIISIAVPMAILLISYGLYDTMLGLAFIYSIPNIGLTAWITRSIFIGLDKELEEASFVFGATKLRTLRSITLPLVIPGFAAASMYAFIIAWNDAAVALLLTDRNQTLALLIFRSIGSTGAINYASAGAILLIIPALIFTFLLKDYINRIWG
ncbi:MAG: carbohydrate ABC transporter permease [Bacillota bacterium]